MDAVFDALTEAVHQAKSVAVGIEESQNSKVSSTLAEVKALQDEVEKNRQEKQAAAKTLKAQEQEITLQGEENVKLTNCVGSLRRQLREVKAALRDQSIDPGTLLSRNHASDGGDADFADAQEISHKVRKRPASDLQHLPCREGRPKSRKAFEFPGRNNVGDVARTAAICTLFCLEHCFRKHCPLRHPSDAEAKSLREKWAKTPCRTGVGCSRPGCLFHHAEERVRSNGQKV
ncbi:unnamed protein product [Cladocopium goreaui]|uniref:C3H1-type domain-containing protein n=1 Tax=Cladocopium goreaui TaxID=2562237 RepID=A0A9P1CXI2_9DINO|nr:unnamed protein product [Cladocopium goreaui]|mmetsp:Transcript_47653/g.103913  ORF Transcript_47653/g.103913 Transcript_47653/m.103913 type:complete len:232 (+) Transcript_47653:32-727(+)